MNKKLIIGKNGFIAKKLLCRKKYLSTTSNKEDAEGLFLDLLDLESFDFNIINNNVMIC